MTSPSAILPDTFYHIYNRGVNRENIFIEDRNYAYFMQLYEKYITPVAETYAYCLLKNHFHFLIRTKSEDEITKTRSSISKPLGWTPSAHFSNFFTAYAKSINHAYGRTGSLFQHPFGRIPVETNRQLWNIIAYIHQNPQKHHFVEDFRQWKYSSYITILSEKPTQVNREVVFEWFGGKQQYLDLHQVWVDDAKAKWFISSDFD